MKTNSPTQPATPPRITSSDEWLKARKALLAKEKQLTHLRETLAQERRQLPWVRLAKDYALEGVRGPTTLSSLFGPRSQLIVYHFMLGPGWDEGCKSCSYVSDHFDGMLLHLAARDVAFAAISHAPYAEIAPFRERMGWAFPWYSAHGSGFNQDFHVSFSEADVAAGTSYYNFEPCNFPHGEEAPGVSVFARDAAGNLYHTYSTYSRGLDGLIGTYNFLDLVPKGRDEEGLEHTMSWVRHHDRYDSVLR